ncbi:hypothetical protein FB451DRAFT_1412960 [Mycena latifolia]|nr:hypothetical protein FB451DRAFT_1412960 [Mycena latifolia]
MFEDICLACGRDVFDGRAYCNDACQSGDLTSPALSESSSAFSSPHLQYANGQDVPALVPSALGRALRAYTAHDRYSASSSSASSTSWSVVTDDDDELSSEYDARELDMDGPHHALHPALSYARRPSGTNNRTTFPHLHRRTDSDSFGCSFPQSAPNERLCPPDDDDTLDDPYADEDFASEDPARPATATITATAAPTKARRKRNRASLPAYFSMLQIAASPATLPPAYPRASPISSSSGHTLPMRPSPPTPKLSLMAGLAAAHALTAPPTPAHTHSHHAYAHHTHQTPRGRRRESAAGSGSRRPSRASASRSPSPARRRDSDEKVADWSDALARARGRAVRRNSSCSPAPPAAGLTDARRSASPMALRASRDRERSRSDSGSRARTRGRARVEELDGPGSPERPGFGHGRSGLLARATRRDEGWVPL